MNLSKLIYLSLGFLFSETEKKVLPNRRRARWDDIRETGDTMNAHRACARWMSESLGHSEWGGRPLGWGPDRIEWSSEILHHQLCDLACMHACVRACMLSHFTHAWLFATLSTVTHQAPLSKGFSRQEYWSRLPCPLPGDLADPGIEPASLSLLHWQAGSLSLAPPRIPSVTLESLKSSKPVFF